MQRVKKHWYNLPDSVRRILVFIVGVALIITAGLLGPIPGPGGSIVFLLGIAVLASEFTWAERVRDYIFDLYKKTVVFIKKKPLLSALVATIAIIFGSFFLVYFYRTVF